jgi:tripartite-type tricarboxylate transporter receptor subunit TctC
MGHCPRSRRQAFDERTETHNGTDTRKMLTSLPKVAAPLALLAGTVLPGAPVGAADFYAGKTIEVIVGGAAAGGVDLYARAVARHLPHHIPGNPTIVVKNLPGASGARAGYHVAMVAPGNGLTIGAITPGAIVGPLLDDKAKTTFDPSRLIYLGTTNAGVGICATMSASGTKTFADALKRKTVLGAQGPGAVSYDIAYLVKNLTGAQYNIVTGYNGSTHFLLAMERGEIDGICGWNWSSAKSQKPDWLRDKKLNLLLQTGASDDDELTQMGVPSLSKFISGDEHRRIAEFILAQKGFERPLLVGPGTPSELVKILRTAFDATMRDPQFLAEMKKGRLDVSPASGARVQELVRAFYATPKDIVAKARAAIRP